MRDYLFRGKRKDNGEWVEGCGIIATENWVSIFTVIDDIDENSSEVNEIEVIPETVGQYTGLKDKNGTKIFEGDIVLVPYIDPIFKCTWNDTSSCERAIVKYCNGMFYVEYIESGDKFTLSAVDEYMKIIGNIYDNPEPLGENKMAVKTDYKVGDKVVFISENKHEEFPNFYPEVGTVGTVVGVDGDVFVKWEEGSTSSNDRWFCWFDWIIPAKEYFKKEKEKGNVKKNDRKFKVGDRVRVIKDCDDAKKGMVGTIAVIHKPEPYSEKTIGVKFDKKFYGGHSLAGRCEYGFGHWVYPDCIEIISDNKIVITTDGKTTTARFYDGKKVIKAAKAECSPEDEFDFKIGAKIAFDRLVDNEIKNPRKYYNGKVVFSENTGGFKEGILYVFRSNGNVEDFFGNPVFSHGQKITHTYNSFSDIYEFYGDIVAEVK